MNLDRFDSATREVQTGGRLARRGLNPPRTRQLPSADARPRFGRATAGLTVNTTDWS
ncbi:MAG TPA: hypothetical protein VKB50_16415 [Vicinamibacterales bacterium]|nr:hypothetical protein [Vicinamibacterales bacterium]